MQMQTELTKELLARLDVLAGKLGTTAQELWVVLTRQAKIEAFQEFTFGMGMVVMTCLSYKAVRVMIDKVEKKGGDGYAIGAIFTGVAGAVFSVIALVAFCGLPTLVLNPKYWALRQIMGAMGR